MNRICSCVAYWFNPFYSACNATEQFKDLSCQRKIAVVFATAIASPLLAFVGTAGFFRFFTTRFSPSATKTDSVAQRVLQDPLDPLISKTIKKVLEVIRDSTIGQESKDSLTSSIKASFSIAPPPVAISVPPVPPPPPPPLPPPPVMRTFRVVLKSAKKGGGRSPVSFVQGIGPRYLLLQQKRERNGKLQEIIKTSALPENLRKFPLKEIVEKLIAASKSLNVSVCFKKPVSEENSYLQIVFDELTKGPDAPEEKNIQLTEGEDAPEKLAEGDIAQLAEGQDVPEEVTEGEATQLAEGQDVPEEITEGDAARLAEEESARIVQNIKQFIESLYQLEEEEAIARAGAFLEILTSEEVGLEAILQEAANPKSTNSMSVALDKMLPQALGQRRLAVASPPSSSPTQWPEGTPERKKRGRRSMGAINFPSTSPTRESEHVQKAPRTEIKRKDLKRRRKTTAFVTRISVFETPS